MRAYFIIIFLLFTQFSFSQDCLPLNGKVKRECNRVEKLLIKKDIYKAQKILNHIRYRESNPRINQLLAIVWWKQGEDLVAEEFALKAIELCPNRFPLLYYLLGEINYKRKLYQTSEIYLEKCLSIGIEEKYKVNAEKYYNRAKIISDIISNPVLFEPQTVKGVSTNHDEYLPILSPDQEIMFYTRRSEKNEIGSLTKSNSEDFMFSMEDSSNFNSGFLMPFPFNRNNNEGGASITIENNTLYFTVCSKTSSGYNNCDLFYSFKHGNKWSKIKSFNKQINGVDSWESQPSVSADGNSIIFASDRKGGFGESDLYITSKKNNGDWTRPNNLGENINTKMNEKSPFLHTDNETIFFSSNQFPSIGGYDIFFSRKDSSGVWQKPQNIGYPINTVADELGLFVSTDGQKAYFASNQLNGVGGWDLYSFNLYDEAKPKKVFFLKGELKDKNNQLIDDARIELKNIRTKEKKIINVQNGKYITAFTIEEPDDFLLTINKKGYAFNSKYLSSSNDIFSSPSKIDFNIEKLKNGYAYRLENIYFATNSFTLSNVSKEILIAFLDYLKINNRLKVIICGHTDDVGTKNDNLLLSKNRAKSVYSFLIENGTKKNRIDYKGFGEEKPITSNETEEGRAKNRRTEFVILGQ